jgi:ankyrin repeat protein
MRVSRLLISLLVLALVVVGIAQVLQAMGPGFANQALVAAVRRQDLAAARRALRRGANANATNPEGDAVIFWCVKYPQPEMVRLLLAHGAAPDVRPAGGVTPLMEAAGRNDRAILETLLASGDGVNAENDYGVTALMYAVRARNATNARVLLARGADPQHKATDGRTALATAREAGMPEIEALLRVRDE